MYYTERIQLVLYHRYEGSYGLSGGDGGSMAVAVYIDQPERGFCI